LYNTGTSSVTQITHTSGGTNRHPSISGAGTRIAFESDRNLTGNNGDGNFEIFLYDTGTSSFTQITNTTAGTTDQPPLSADVTRSAFAADQNLTARTANGTREIFLYDTGTSSITQVTDTTTGVVNEQPAINADGTRIAFVSDRDGNREIFLADTVSGTTTQVTVTSGGTSEQPAINTAGRPRALPSHPNHTGGNARR